jgi:hypothetical protein
MANEFKIKNGLVVSGSADFEQDLTVRGRLTADELHISIVSSSVLFESGSTQFGNSITDTHKVTGSLSITGSMSLNGQPIGTGKLDETTFQLYTASIDPRIANLETSTGSINGFTSSTNLRLTSLETSTGSINTYTASNTTNIDAIHTSTSSLNTFTSSANGRLNSIEGVTGSISSLNTYTGSNNTIIGTLQTSTGSLNTFTSSAAGRLNSIETSTGSLNSYTASNTTNINAIHTSTSSLNTFTSSANGRLSSIETSTGSLNLYTSSNTTNINAIHTATSSLNSYTSSNTTAVNALNTSTASLNSYTSSNNTVINALNSYTSSNTTNISAIHTATSSLNSYTSSNTTAVNALNTSTASLNSYTSSNTTNINAIHTTTGSLNSYTSSNTTNINAIHTATGSLNAFTSSASGRLTSLESASSSIRTDFNSFTSSNNTVESTQNSRLTSLETTTGSLNSYTSSNTTNINAIHTATGSLNSYTSSNNTRLGIIETATSSLNSYTSSNNTKLGIIETATSSLNSFTSSINTTIKNRLNTEGVVSGSVQVTLSSTTGYSTFSSSLATTDLGQDNRLTSLEGKTGSYATTGSNVFQGSQIITGSLFISQDLIVAGSSSIQHISSSVVNIADNIITVNAQNPSIRFGGLAVIDSGSSPQISGSILFDSVNDQWIFVHQNQTTVTSSILLMGPQTFNNLGNETSPTNNRLLKSVNAEHLGDSNISDTGTKVSVNSNTEITGSLIVAGGNKITVNATGGDEGGEILLGKAVTNTTLSGEGVTIDVWQNRLRIFEQGGNARGAYLDISTLANGVGTNLLGTVATASYVEFSNVANKPSLVSGSSQISFNGITDKPTLVSGSAQISFNSITDKPTLVSGSSQITFLSISSIPAGLVSGSSQVLNGSGVWSGSAQLPAGTVSGSSQVLNGSGVWSGSAQLPSGVVSGSSQITYSSISSIPAGIVSGSAQVISLLPSGTVSGSSQVLAGTTIHSGAFFNGISVVSGSAQISFNGITDKPALVSGSSQITFGSITGVPSGLVSGSSQITFLSISSIPSGLVSGSSQVAFSSLSGLPSGIVSGSSQISFGSISGVPSGLVSGSSQITYGSLSGIPSGIVSGSSQISFGSISGIPSGLVSGSSQITFSGISSKPTTISGYGITDAITTGNIGSQTVASAGNSTTVGGLTPIQFFNNMGDNHSTRTSFDASTPSYGFGFRFVQGNTNGPATGGGGQFYSWYIGLGNDYPATGGGSYGMQVAIPRTATTPYMSIRYNENNSLGSWLKIAAGYADTAGSATTAGSLSSMNISQFTNNTGYITGISFANVSSKPTTISGYGITDAITTGNIGSQSVSYATTAGSLTSMNISQFTNNSGYITGIAFSSVSSKPTTLSGYGITDSLYQDRATVDVNAFNTTGLYRGSTSGWSNRPTVVHNGGALLQIDTHPGNYHSQLFFDTGGNRLYMRSADAGSWGSWVTMYHSGNLTNLNQLTNGPGYITGISFANVSSKPTTISGYGITDAITTSNIGSQSVSYASSAGSAPNGTNQNSVYNVTPGEGNGLRFWSEDNYKISMGVSSVYQYGTVNDYSIKTQMNSGDAGRGFTWGRIGVVPIASLNATSGNMQLAGSLTTGGSILPLSNNSVNLGSVSLGWANVYTNDLHLSNMNKPEGNDIDGTKGTWTIQEGEENLYIINNNNGKKFKISLEEII